MHSVTSSSSTRILIPVLCEMYVLLFALITPGSPLSPQPRAVLVDSTIAVNNVRDSTSNVLYIQIPDAGMKKVKLSVSHNL